MQELKETLPVGSIIRGRYQVEKLLGKGGFGAVYLVKDQRVRQNLFALKEVIDPNRRERERFTFEADLLKRVDHPSLPRVYRVFEDDANDRAYMLMDYIEGSNLEVLRQRQPNKRFNVQQVLSIMKPIMDAVTYLHNQRPPIIHRDIKPSNIIVPSSGDDAVLVDFGIAKEYDPESTTTAVRHASPGYGAPEQYATGTNTRTDIYGLGATMYALLTGVVPMDAFYRTTSMGSKGTDPLEPISRYAPNVPKYIADAIYKAMAIDMNERFPTVQDFWKALTVEPVALAPSAVAATSTPPITPLPVPAQMNTPVPPIDQSETIALREPTRRRKLPVGWLILVLLLLVAAIAGALFLPALISHNQQQGHSTPTSQPTHKPVATQTAGVKSTPSVVTSPGSSPGTTPSPTQGTNPTPSPSPAQNYPGVTGNYSGTIIDQITSPPTSARMGLAIQQQQGGNISGQFTVRSPLSGSGPFSGFVTKAGYIQFVVTGRGINPLLFTGNVQSNGVLAGNYCSLDSTGHCSSAAGGYGTWQVFPSSSGSSYSTIFPTDLFVSFLLRREEY